MLAVTTPVVRTGAVSLLDTAFIQLNTYLIKRRTAAFAFSGEEIALPEGVKYCTRLIQLIPARKTFRGRCGFKGAFSNIFCHADGSINNCTDGDSSLLIFKYKQIPLN